MHPVLYNNFKQIVQTPTHVMILVEMNHDARIIPFSKTHGPDDNRKWMGDSIAWWEGDTLVIETTNFTTKTRYRGATENLKVTERFSRLDDKTLLYRFTIDDPATWTRPWSGRVSVREGQGRRAAPRVRVPRRQPLVHWHPEGRAAARRGARQGHQGKRSVRNFELELK